MRVHTTISNITAYAEYVKFRETDRGRFLACAFALSDPHVVRDGELWALLEIQPRFDEAGKYVPLEGFEYDPARHAPLKECVVDKELKELFLNPTWNRMEEIKDGRLVQQDEVRQVRAGIAGKVGENVAYFDVGLMGYTNELGDKRLICENFASYLTAGWHDEKLKKQGPFGALLVRLIKLKILRADNYVNVFSFTNAIKNESDDFRKPMDCTRIVAKGFVGRVVGLIRMLGGNNVDSAEPKPRSTS